MKRFYKLPGTVWHLTGQLIHINSLSNGSFSLTQTGRQASFTHFVSAMWMRDRQETAKGAIETVLKLIAESQLRVQSVPLQGRRFKFCGEDSQLNAG